jgi:hypothetical protein
MGVAGSKDAAGLWLADVDVHDLASEDLGKGGRLL